MNTGLHLLGSGRTADVYALEPGWVLRRYRDGLDAGPEAAAMAYVRAHGFPAPRVRPDTARGPGDLVMERLDGPTQAEELLSGALDPAAAGAELAVLLRRLHAVPARAGGHIVHLDLHPENVIRTADGPVVIDWCTTQEGDPALDWAMSAIILAEVTLHPDWSAAAPGLRGVLTALLADPAPGTTGTALDEARARRTANPTLTGAEKARLGAAAELVRAVAGAAR
ncbi:phosphotransferase [Streptomyces sp. SID5785]|uniref:phosphotransferase n=1 Tax=Streptomyces sp. SID5785 TaxID=2690309 RepID=UPI001361D38B|nr:phosphotransferase [Streptomyces sp. SID5785]MZD09270.1 phosphotransferase [Streptomyces sp. SID5785]